jgi:hypothetical protein
MGGMNGMAGNSNEQPTEGMGNMGMGMKGGMGGSMGMEMGGSMNMGMETGGAPTASPTSNPTKAPTSSGTQAPTEFIPVNPPATPCASYAFAPGPNANANTFCEAFNADGTLCSNCPTQDRFGFVCYPNDADNVCTTGCKRKDNENQKPTNPSCCRTYPS